MMPTEPSCNAARVPVSQIPIAVVVVTRNCLHALNATVDSLWALRDVRLRPIFVDGASTDGTAARIAELTDNGAYYACSEPDRGIYDAMNKGWLAAPSEAFILYLGAGDLLLELPEDRSLRDDNGRPYPVILGECCVGKVPFRSRWSAEMRLRNTAHHQAMLVHKSVSECPPFDTRLRIYGDWDFNLRMLERGIAARHVSRFRTYAELGGASWRHDLDEIKAVATRHSGIMVGAAALAFNYVSRWRRDRSESHEAAPQE